MSRRPERIAAVLAVLGELWAQDPDQRLGQLLSNVTRETDLFNVEDWALVSLLVEDLKERDHQAYLAGMREFMHLADGQPVTYSGGENVTVTKPKWATQQETDHA